MGIVGPSAPSGPASGDLTGEYPGPTIGAEKVTTADVKNEAVTEGKVANNAINSNQCKPPNGLPAPPAEGAEKGNVNAPRVGKFVTGEIIGNGVRTVFTFQSGLEFGTSGTNNIMAQAWVLAGGKRTFRETQPKISMEGGIVTVTFGAAPAAKEEILIFMLG